VGAPCRGILKVGACMPQRSVPPRSVPSRPAPPMPAPPTLGKPTSRSCADALVAPRPCDISAVSTMPTVRIVLIELGNQPPHCGHATQPPAPMGQVTRRI
jgi:hypothetical protein